MTAFCGVNSLGSAARRLGCSVVTWLWTCSWGVWGVGQQLVGLGSSAVRCLLFCRWCILRGTPFFLVCGLVLGVHGPLVSSGSFSKSRNGMSSPRNRTPTSNSTGWLLSSVSISPVSGRSKSLWVGTVLAGQDVQKRMDCCRVVRRRCMLSTFRILVCSVSHRWFGLGIGGPKHWVLCLSMRSCNRLPPSYAKSSKTLTHTG